MPVVAKRTLMLKDAEGKTTILSETDQVAEIIDVTVTCDGPKCESRNGKQSQVSWNGEKVKEDPNSLPDDFYRLITMIVNSKTNEQHVFCSAQCGKDYLTYTYVRPLSPREEAELLISNQKAANKQLNVLPFPTPKPQETAPIPAGEEIAAGMEALQDCSPEDDDGLDKMIDEQVEQETQEAFLNQIDKDIANEGD